MPGSSLVDDIALPPRRKASERIPAALLLADWVAGEEERGDGLALVAELRELLRGHGVASAVPRVPSGADPASLIAAVERAITRLAEDDAVMRNGIGLIGFGHGAALACLLGARSDVRCVALVGPVSVEVAARRLDRSGDIAADRENMIRGLAALQPLKALASAAPRPVLILRGAADERHAADHAIGMAMALSLDGRPLERCEVAFGDQALGDASVRAAVAERLATFVLGSGS